MIVPTTFKPDTEGHFLLRLFSEDEANLKLVSVILTAHVITRDLTRDLICNMDDAQRHVFLSYTPPKFAILSIDITCR